MNMEADVIVAGGGPAGIAAALAAAQAGAKVILVERYGFLGGTATAALMCVFATFSNGREQVIKGMAEMLFNAVKQAGGSDNDCAKDAWLWVDLEVLKQVALEMLLKAKVQVLLHTLVSEPVLAEHLVKGLIVDNKSGRQAITAAVTVDATGDADILARSGGEFDIGGDGDGVLQPMSMAFRIVGVDETQFRPDRRNEFWEIAHSKYNISIPLYRFLHLHRVCPGEYNVHATRILDADGADGFSYSNAEIAARRQCWELFDIMKKEMPGMATARISQTAVQVGVRETRRIRGVSRLETDDVLCAHKSPDAIGRGCYRIDLHDGRSAQTLHRPLGAGEYYDIPYGCLVPVRIDGLLVAGRPISASHIAHASVRVMSHCMVTGHAAGAAAALAVNAGVQPRAVDIGDLRRLLQAQNAVC